MKETKKLIENNTPSPDVSGWRNENEMWKSESDAFFGCMAPVKVV